jgi:hypothetical protein
MPGYGGYLRDMALVMFSGQAVSEWQLFTILNLGKIRKMRDATTFLVQFASGGWISGTGKSVASFALRKFITLNKT